jgi:hypothetical protein
LFTNLASSQYDVYSTATTEIHNHITWLKVREAGRVTTSPREVESDLRNRGKRFLVIEPLINSKARTGLLLAGSAGLLVAACFSEFSVAVLHNLVDSVSFHFSHSSFFLRMLW